MCQHPELIFWLKCPSCGYCELDVETYSKKPKACKLTKYNQLQIPECTTKEQCDCSNASHKELHYWE